jgi:mRNA interferase YafQ
MYSISYTRSFEKDVKRIKKREYNTIILFEVIKTLEETGTVPTKLKPHKLSGNFKDCWECHLKSDWLLIWRKSDNKNEIQLIRTGTHSDLF